MFVAEHIASGEVGCLSLKAARGGNHLLRETLSHSMAPHVGRA